MAPDRSTRNKELTSSGPGKDNPGDSRDELVASRRSSRNWARWTSTADRGALNLATAAKVRSAVSLVTDGSQVSLSRPAPAGVLHVRTVSRPDGGAAAVDDVQVSCHGLEWTHLDALCHAWDKDGMWDGHDPSDEIEETGIRWGGVEAFSSGIITRGVLLDIPKFRGQSFVDIDRPVEKRELEATAEAENVRVGPGDALIVYSGREKWEEFRGRRYGLGPDVQRDSTKLPDGTEQRPGLGPSCLYYLRASDCAVLVWDMMDAVPSAYDIPWPVHATLYLHGVALIDNAFLEPLAMECERRNRYEFLFMASPLKIVGGTGSPVNPIVCF